jgi:hypothetical protein
MAVCRQSVDKILLAHQDKTDGVAQRIGFVQSRLQQNQRLVVNGRINPNSFGLRTRVIAAANSNDGWRGSRRAPVKAINSAT